MIDLSKYPERMLEISALVMDQQVRSAGVDPNHVAALAELDGPLPPIVVHEPTMTVVDGAHRVLAARARGLIRISGIMLDVAVDEVFVLAVSLNTRHGLPLSRPDRQAAMQRILLSHSNWSDRRIAAAAGVSPKTVAAARQRSGEECPQPNKRRLGADGRAFRLETTDARRQAAAILAQEPDATVRQVARAAGISPSTVQDVRRRLEQGLDPVPKPAPAAATREVVAQRTPVAVGAGAESARAVSDLPAAQEAHRHPPGLPDDPAPEHWPTEELAAVERPRRRADDPDMAPETTIENLSRDPSVRSSEGGRTLLRLFVANAQGLKRLTKIAHSVPPHQQQAISHLARWCSKAWLHLAHEIESLNIP